MGFQSLCHPSQVCREKITGVRRNVWRSFIKQLFLIYGFQFLYKKSNRKTWSILKITFERHEILYKDNSYEPKNTSAKQLSVTIGCGHVDQLSTRVIQAQRGRGALLGDSSIAANLAAERCVITPSQLNSRKRFCMPFYSPFWSFFLKEREEWTKNQEIIISALLNGKIPVLPENRPLPGKAIKDQTHSVATINTSTSDCKSGQICLKHNGTYQHLPFISFKGRTSRALVGPFLSQRKNSRSIPKFNIARTNVKIKKSKLKNVKINTTWC